MEIFIIISYSTLIWVIFGLILMRPMKVLRIVVPLIVVAASALLFVFGWDLEREGNAMRESLRYSDGKVIGHAISDFGNIVKCIGVLGALVGLALFGALWYLGAYKRQILLRHVRFSHIQVGSILG